MNNFIFFNKIKEKVKEKIEKKDMFFVTIHLINNPN